MWVSTDARRAGAGRVRCAHRRHLRRSGPTSDGRRREPLSASGDPFGSLEAAKFVGPLTAPVSGVIAAVNGAVLADPESVLRDPYGRGWLAEFTVAGPDARTASTAKKHAPGSPARWPTTGRRVWWRSDVHRIRHPTSPLRRRDGLLRARAQGVEHPGVDARQPASDSCRFRSPGRPAPCPATTARPRCCTGWPASRPARASSTSRRE